MRLPDSFRSTSFRLGTIYAALFFVSTLAILGITYFTTTAEVEGISRRSIVEDMAAFQSAFAQGGAEELIAVARRRTENAADDHFYLLVDASGAPIAGNLPAGLWQEGWTNRRLSRDVVASTPALTFAASLNADGEVWLFGEGLTIGGLRLLAGRNSHILDETQEILLGALVGGGAVSVLLALVGGYAVSIGPTRRVDRIAALMREIAGGRFDLRLGVTERRDEIDRLSGDINAMLAQIEALMSSLRQVSTDIAHDLRTPLARLRQGLERARRDDAPPDILTETMDDAVLEVDSIIATFNALLRIAQIEAGARKAKFRRVDLSAVLGQMHEVYEGVAEESGHRLGLDIEEGLVVEGDRDLLQQLFANLIENALTHAPAPADILLTARRRGDTIVAAVDDNGPGIPKEERQKVFRRLYRLDRSRTTPGNGLGLALAAAISDLHGATIEAKDGRPGEATGLRMEIAFPAQA